jgi:L-asparagine transporter-like permease
LLVIAGQIWGQAAAYQLLGYEVVWVWCVSWALTLWAAFNFRRKYGDVAAGLPWRVPLWPLTPVIAVVGIVVTVYALFRDVWLTYGSTTCIIFTLVSLAIVWVVWAIMQKIKPGEEKSLAAVAEGAAVE